VIRLLAFIMLLVLPVKSGSQHQLPRLPNRWQRAYGLDSFGQIEGIRYTFNAEFPGVQLSHKWEWNPKANTVSYEGKDKEGKPVKVTYQRSQLSSQRGCRIRTKSSRRSSMISYWLLFPLHVAMGRRECD
jgi:hypothetical protein